ncbi:hypothetical protein, partial [Pseudonocardia alni]|uniref:hypothetical protein n=1 Tax=Pseudonocardia alni TaxID=33907 RepID=UPI00331ED895
LFIRPPPIYTRIQLHSFPTRRSSDLAADPRAAAQEALRRLVQGDQGAGYDVFADRHPGGGHPG